jgi:hypothetical protein
MDGLQASASAWAADADIFFRQHTTVLEDAAIFVQSVRS